MKRFLFAIILILFFNSCEIKPEFYKNGKGYYTRERCLQYKTETVFEYHYGYSIMRGKFCWHWGNNTKTKCILSVIDTIEVKTK